MSKGTEYLRNVLAGREKEKGVPSICSSNEYVLKAGLEYVQQNGEFIIIEATSNQVNQFGGYTNLRPAEFKDFVYRLADQAGLDRDKIILGGDHLGPLVFANRHEDEAMKLAEEMISEYVRAGFEKIHIDTSMRLVNDPRHEPLTDAVIARRGARLCRAAEKAFEDAFKRSSELVYVVGSEVPIPGGTQASSDEMHVTRSEDFKNTYDAFEDAFCALQLDDAFKRVVAVVVQPGVEFGDDAVKDYDSNRAAALMEKLKEYRNIVFEGHSTDYQTQEALCKMASDGVRILKVGPELTFALREGLFALQFMSNELGTDVDFTGTLDRVMTEKSGSWSEYYVGSSEQIAFKRKYSYSDRWRYYANEKTVVHTIEDLIAFMDSRSVPLTLLSQFMPEQYEKIRKKELEMKAVELINYPLKKIMAKFYTAVKHI